MKVIGLCRNRMHIYIYNMGTEDLFDSRELNGKEYGEMSGDWCFCRSL